MSFRCVQFPEHEEVIEIVEDGIRFHRMILLVASCQIRFDGRAKSFLPFGERLLIIKSDGSLLIHTNKKYQPVNWQSHGCRIQLEKKDDILHIVSRKTNPLEILRVEVEKSKLITSFILEDDQKISVFGSEEDMVKIVYQNPEMIEEGFKPFKRERVTDTGEIDIYGVDKHNNLVVIEAKIRTASHTAVHQLIRYVDSIKEKNPEKKVRGILLAPAVTPKARKILDKNSLEFRRMIPNITKDPEKDNQMKLF